MLNYFLEGAALWGTKVRPWRSARPEGDIPFLKVIQHVPARANFALTDLTSICYYTYMSLSDIINNTWTVTIGGTVIAAGIISVLAFIIRRILGTQKEQQIQINNQSEIIANQNSKPTQPTIKGTKNESAGYILVKKLNEEPPYTREESEKAYIGQTLEQEARFVAIRPSQTEGLTHISLVSKEGFPWIYTDINLSDYPWLKTLKADTYVRLKGVILSFSGHEISLEITELGI